MSKEWKCGKESDIRNNKVDSDKDRMWLIWGREKTRENADRRGPWG